MLFYNMRDMQLLIFWVHVLQKLIGTYSVWLLLICLVRDPHFIDRCVAFSLYWRHSYYKYLLSCFVLVNQKCCQWAISSVNNLNMFIDSFPDLQIIRAVLTSCSLNVIYSVLSFCFFTLCCWYFIYTCLSDGVYEEE